MKINGFNMNEPKSSFYLPNEENHQINEALNDSENESKEQSEEEKLADEIIKKSIASGISIEESDIIDYLRKGFIKKSLEIIPKRLYATIKTLTVKEMSESNTEFSQIIADNSNLIDIEARLRNTKCSMYYFLLELGESPKNLKSLHSNSPEAKKFFYDQIEALPPFILSQIAEAHRLLEATIQAHVMHPKIGKK